MLESIVAFIIGIIVFVIVIGGIFIYSTLSWGLVLYKFWGWFVLPIFVTLPALTFVQALGLMFVISLFKNQTIQSIKKEYKDESTTMSLIFLSPWISLFFGWLAYIIFIV